MRNVRLKYQRCMASFPAQTAKFSSNYVMTSTSRGVVPLRANIKAAQFLATSAFGLAPHTAWSLSSPVATSNITQPLNSTLDTYGVVVNIGRVGGTVDISTSPSSYNSE